MSLQPSLELVFRLLKAIEWQVDANGSRSLLYGKDPEALVVDTILAIALRSAGIKCGGR